MQSSGVSGDINCLEAASVFKHTVASESLSLKVTVSLYPFFCPHFF